MSQGSRWWVGIGVAATVLAAMVAMAAPQEDETVMARKAGVTLPEAMTTATRRVAGRVTWASRERYDGKTFVLVQVVQVDRTVQTVTLDAASGGIVKVEPQPKAADKPKAEKKKDPGSARPAVRGTIPVGNVRPSEYPYLAKLSMQEAVSAALASRKGRVVEVYLYAEDGWLLFGIEISPRVGSIEIVQVDAGTGKVLGTVKM